MLTGDFEQLGSWWLPDNPGRVLQGALRSSGNVAELKLLGCFSDSALGDRRNRVACVVRE
jgi:hypothetical protein